MFDAFTEAAALAGCLEHGTLSMDDLTLAQWQGVLAYLDGREDRRVIEAAMPKPKEGGFAGSSLSPEELAARLR